jgi:hypothetical protein
MTRTCKRDNKASSSGRNESRRLHLASVSETPERTVNLKKDILIAEYWVHDKIRGVRFDGIRSSWRANYVREINTLNAEVDG